MDTQVSLSEIINFENSLFKDKQAVKTNYALTGIGDILHRNNEIKQYYQYLKDIFRVVSPSNVFIHGKTGVGKTILTKWVLEEIKNEASNRNIELTIIKIKCDVAKTENGMWQAINDNMPMPKGEKKRKIGNSISKHANYFEYLLNNYSGILLIVLDEIDKASDPQMINKIIRMESTLSKQFPCVIGITNDLFIYNKFPAELTSVLSQRELVIKPYDAYQLIDILNARIKMAFVPGVVPEVVVGLCAAFAAQEHGEARRAIDLLRVSGELAEERQSNIIEEEDVRNANKKIEIERVNQVIQSLPKQSKITLLACIYVFDNVHKENTTANVYNVYMRICTALDSDLLTWRRIVDLINELDLLGLISVIVKHGGRYGRQKQIVGISAKEQALKTLYNDYNIKLISEISPSKFFD